ncbi:MAG: hypothetical protein AAFY60_15240, partial [Myxococcota bacterium]
DLTLSENLILGGGSTAPDATCGVSGSSTSVGVEINAVPTGFSFNAVSGGSGPSSGCATSSSVGIDTVGGLFQNSFVDGGSACGGPNDRSVGYRVRAGEDITIENAVILGGSSANPVGVRVDAGGGYTLGAVTFYDVSGEDNSVAIESDGIGGTVRNSIFFDYAVAIRDLSESASLSVVGNNAFQVRDAIYEPFGDNAVVTVGELEAALAGATGNTEGGVVFVDPAGPDGDPLTLEDTNLNLAPESSCDVREGGQSNVVSIATDLDISPRTTFFSCTPTVSNAGGWSMGAYETE